MCAHVGQSPTLINPAAVIILLCCGGGGGGMEEAEINGIRKLSTSSSPTRSSAPEQRNRSASPPPPPRGVPRWLILDRTVHWSRRRRCGVVENDATASALAHDCVGRPVRASLRIASPPAISRLYVHLTGRPPIECLSQPRTVAAHRSAILFHVAAPFEDPLLWSRAPFFPHDYFVYSSGGGGGGGGGGSSPARLTLLPPCFHGGAAPDPKVDYLFQPYRNQRQRMMTSQDVGILCHGDDQFTVAQLTFGENDQFELCVLHHPPPPSSASSTGSSMEWILKKKLQNPTAEYADGDYRKINIYSWVTDAVVPVGTRCLGWVDYYQGIILADVLLPIDTDSSSSSSSNRNPDDHHRQQSLRYIPLPKKALKYRRPYRDADSPDPLRCVGVTDSGTVKLVCILTERPAPSCPFTITTWTLDDRRGGGRWVMDRSNGMGSHTMGEEEFFGLLGGAGHGFLPRVQPSFPLVSLGDPDVVCFLLRDDKDRGVFWMIEVDMRNEKLLSSAIYISEEEEEGYPLKMKRGRQNMNFYGDYFIPTKFSSYLTEDAITSWELSEKMQEAKKERVMQKIGLEAELKK